MPLVSFGPKWALFGSLWSAIGLLLGSLWLPRLLWGALRFRMAILWVPVSCLGFRWAPFGVPLGTHELFFGVPLAASSSH